MRLLNPKSRQANLPPGVTSFAHYMTEHGSVPEEAGITDKKQALDYKAKSLIRSVLFWLNKGISKIYIYSAYQPSELEQGMLLEQPKSLPYSDYTAAQLFSPALQALKNVVELFRPVQALPETETRQLEAAVSGLGTQYKVFEGDASHPPLYYRDMTCILPFQATPFRFIIAYYIMSYDFSQPLPAMNIRITLRKLPDTQPNVLLYDPIINRYFLSQEIKYLENGVALSVEAKDYPLFIVLDYPQS
jgi:hypothetical protein